LATRKKSPRKSTRRAKRSANPIDDALARLERDVPRLLRQMRSNVKVLHGQVGRARSDGEKRWKEAERKIKKDATQLKQRLEKAIGRMRGKAKSVRAQAAKAASRVGKATRPAKRKAGTRKRKA